jgi:hypothetical protein
MRIGGNLMFYDLAVVSNLLKRKTLNSTKIIVHRNEMKTNLLSIFILLFAIEVQSKVILYPAPRQEPASKDFRMFVNDQPVFVYQARVSKYPINQVWPGYQRPINQTELASFAYFDFSGKVTIRVESEVPISTLDIRPKLFGINPVVKGKTITFNLPQPMHFVVEVNGYHNALHVFTNPIEEFNINQNDSKVHYFGPGIHEAGRIKVGDGETVFIAGGAIVHGSIESINTKNIRIIGRGILDASKIGRTEARNMIYLKGVRNARISGIILRDPQEWAVRPQQSEGVDIDNLKLIGFWRYNADGIDVVSSKNVTIRNCFVRAFDDNIVIKGLRSSFDKQHRIIENINVDHCVLWNDWGRALEIGVETVADTIKNVSFTNCYIPRFTFIAMDIQNGDRAYVKNVRFENIYIEESIQDSARIADKPVDIARMGKTMELIITGNNYFKQDSLSGKISDITFRNIHYNGSKPTFCNFVGLDNTHNVSNVLIRDFFILDQKITGESLLRKNNFVKNVRLE